MWTVPVPVLGAGVAAGAAAFAAAMLASPRASAATSAPWRPAAWDPRKPLSLGEVKHRRQAREEDFFDEVIIQRDVIARIRERVRTWESPRFTVVAGAFGSGKRTAVEQALLGTCGVIVLEVYDNNFEQPLEKLLGEKFPSGQWATVLHRARDALPKENLSRIPVIVLKVNFDRKVEGYRLAIFGKYYAETQSAHVIIVPADVSLALEIQHGGGTQLRDVFVPDFSDAEANDFLSRFGISQADARRIIAEAGCNPRLLHQIGRQVRGGKLLDDVLAENYKYCRGDVQRLLRLRMQDQKGRDCEAGKQIIEALLTSGEEGTKWLEFQQRGFQVKEVMKEIEKMSMFSPECAVVYNTERGVWQFCSPAHRLAAMRSFKQAPKVEGLRGRPSQLVYGAGAGAAA